MQKVRLFKSVENELWSLEQEINRWLEESGVKIVSITGNIAPQTGGASHDTFSASDVLIVVLYEA